LRNKKKESLSVVGPISRVLYLLMQWWSFL